ncbi:MAG TPA: hypothetical protein VFN43_07630, partial [Humibacillus sp.]|nr:hypothetical protein [Humibacillus sp.]
VIGDPRRERLRLLVEVAVVMLTLMLVGAVRARGDLHTDRVLTWLLLIGFVGTLIGSALLWWSMRRPDRDGARAGDRTGDRTGVPGGVRGGGG